MVVQNPIGLLLAALLSLAPRFGATYRTLIFVPTLLSVVIVGFIWELILSPLWGVAETLMSAVGLGGLYAPWLGLESSALVTIIADLGVAVCRHPDDADLRRAACRSRTNCFDAGPGRWARRPGRSSGRSSCR